MRHDGSLLDRLHRNLELEQNDVRRFDGPHRAVQILDREMGIGARSYDDAVFRPVIHRDQSDSRRIFRIRKDKGGVDALFHEDLAGLMAEDIAACLADEGHPAAQTGDSDGLIGPLAAGIHEKSSSDDRFARKRQVAGADYHIGVRTADNEYFLF